MSNRNEQHLGCVPTVNSGEGFTWRRKSAEERLVEAMRGHDYKGIFKDKSDDHIVSVARLWIGINTIK